MVGNKKIKISSPHSWETTDELTTRADEVRRRLGVVMKQDAAGQLDELLAQVEHKYRKQEDQLERLRSENGTLAGTLRALTDIVDEFLDQDVYGDLIERANRIIDDRIKDELDRENG